MGKERDDRMKIVKIIATLVIVAAGFGVNSAFSGNLDTFQKDYTQEMVKTQKEEKVNSDEEKKSKQEESKNEIVSEGNVEENKSVPNKKETAEANNKSVTESKNNTQSTPIQEKTTTTTSNTNTSSISSVPEPQKPQTAWDKLGISEYEYYNTPMIAGDYKDFNNSSQCSRFLDIIESDLDLLGGYQDVLGKYTGGVIGCRIRIYIDGNVYSLSQFKNTQYYTNDIKSKIDAL